MKVRSVMAIADCVDVFQDYKQDLIISYVDLPSLSLSKSFFFL